MAAQAPCGWPANWGSTLSASGRCVDERTHLPTINADHQIARAAGYRVTPILLVNGQQVLATADAVIAAVHAAAQ